MFDFQKEHEKAVAEFLAVPQPVGPQALPKDSPLYQSLMRANQPDYDRHEYDEPRARMSDEEADRMLDARERARDMREAK